MRPMRLLLLFFTLLASATIAFAAEEAPDALAKRTTDEVLTIIRQNSEIKHDKAKLYPLIDAKILPHFDFAHMTRLAVGRHWSEAKPEQQQTLTKEFRTLLVRTYSTALTTYKNQKVVFKPLHMAEGQTDVTVRTESIQAGEKPAPINYTMEKTDNGWKVYDVVVDNVSLITTYRGTFGSEIRKNGVDGLIKMLQQKNQTAGSEKE
ncbi:MAG: ABC transporter substrate-binding protein [Sulfuricella sp.]|nr:ABC transporter substrate-binding protein [Sulfuricella sp.]